MVGLWWDVLNCRDVSYLRLHTTTGKAARRRTDETLLALIENAEMGQDPDQMSRLCLTIEYGKKQVCCSFVGFSKSREPDVDMNQGRLKMAGRSE